MNVVFSPSGQIYVTINYCVNSYFEILHVTMADRKDKFKTWCVKDNIVDIILKVIINITNLNKTIENNYSCSLCADFSFILLFCTSNILYFYHEYKIYPWNPIHVVPL